MAFLAALWIVYLLLRPVRVFPNGLPQPADFLLLLLLFSALWIARSRMVRSVVTPLCIMTLLVGYVVIVNGIWSIAFIELKRNVFSLYFLYNLIAAISFCLIFSVAGVQAIVWTRRAAFMSIAVQTALILTHDSTSSLRAIGSFNRPNQLGYFAVLTGSLYYACGLFLPPTKHSKLGAAFVYLAVVVLSVESLSRASIVACIALLAVHAIVQRSLLAFAVGGLLLVGAAGVVANDRQVLTRFLDDERIQSVENQVGVRGYDRILNDPQYLIFGAGEGGGEAQFSAAHYGEVHSSLGTLAFCYGIVGVSLFLLLIWCVARGASTSLALALAPALIYSLTHNGLRQSEFWILLFIIACHGALFQHRRG